MRKIYTTGKVISSVLAAIFLLIFFIGTNAQSKTGADYFKGKWNVLLKGTPGGDSKIIFLLENRNDSITGVAQDTTGAEISKVTNVELKDDQVTLYFTAQGYDLNLLLKKKDEDHVTGNLIGMFDAEGERVKVIK